MATARSTTARNLRVAETYTDVRGEGVKKRVRAARNNRSRAAPPGRCAAQHGSGCGNKLTRRAGGDHGHRQKEGLGMDGVKVRYSIFNNQRRIGPCYGFIVASSLAIYTVIYKSKIHRSFIR